MKNKDEVYYDNFVACSDCAYQSAKLLEDTLKWYKPNDLQKQMKAMHEIEHRGDNLRHDMMNLLYKAFITPMEREDMIQLSSCLDDITDTIEDVLIQLYICGVQEIKEEAATCSTLIVSCCNQLKSLMECLKELKRGEKIMGHIIKINDLEEEADHLFLASMRTLHTKYSTAIEVIVWREIYNYLEKCMDACEHAADLVEMIMIKNA